MNKLISGAIATTVAAGLLVPTVPTTAAAATVSGSTSIGTVTVNVSDATWNRSTGCQDVPAQVHFTAAPWHAPSGGTTYADVSIDFLGSGLPLLLAQGLHLTASGSARTSPDSNSTTSPLARFCVKPEVGSGTFTLTGNARMTRDGVTETVPLTTTFTMAPMNTEVVPWPWVYQGWGGKTYSKKVSGIVRGIAPIAGPSMRDGKVVVQKKRSGRWRTIGRGAVYTDIMDQGAFDVDVSRKKVKRGTKLRMKFEGNGIGLPSKWAYLRAK